jgi:predicted nucleic acid-binding protein
MVCVAIHFYDTSAIVKRYFIESGSDRVNDLLSHPESGHLLSRLAVVEVNAAIARRAQPDDVDGLMARFDNDARRAYEITIVDDAMFDSAINLVKRYRLRGCDSLQLASAMRVFTEIPNGVFVSLSPPLDHVLIPLALLHQHQLIALPHPERAHGHHLFGSRKFHLLQHIATPTAFEQPALERAQHRAIQSARTQVVVDPEDRNLCPAPGGQIGLEAVHGDDGLAFALEADDAPQVPRAVVD